VIGAALLLAPVILTGQAWNKPYPAYRVAGNLYYVGTNGIAIFLLTTPEGHILIDSGYADTPPLIERSVKSLGFRMEDIKILLTSHAHMDHVSGHAEIRRRTGAQVMAHELDAPVIEGGGKGDFRFEKEYRWVPCPVDRRLKDGDTVSLGGTTLTAHLTSGHTRGNLTWTFPLEGKKAVITGSMSVNPGVRLKPPGSYPGIAADYERSFRMLQALPCDIFLGSHPMIYGMEEKQRRGDFVDPAGYHQFLDEMERTFRQKLGH
jgi:metallo-beta-lactamase class B